MIGAYSRYVRLSRFGCPGKRIARIGLTATGVEALPSVPNDKGNRREDYEYGGVVQVKPQA